MTHDDDDYPDRDDEYCDGEFDDRVKKSHPKYIDNSHPSIQKVGQKILESALEEVEGNFASLNELWMVFADHIRGYEFADQISLQMKKYRDEIIDSIKRDSYDELQRLAYLEVKKDVEFKYGKEIFDILRDELYDEVREKLSDEIGSTLRDEIRLELLEDPDLISEVKDELKRKILGL
jgi:hypothetical protein